MKISIFFLLVALALILLASVQDCDARSPPKPWMTVKPSSNDDSTDAAVKPKKPKTSRNKTDKAAGNGIPHSRRPRAIAADEAKVRDMAAAEDITSIQEMDMFFPVLNDAISNFFNTFTGEPQKKPNKKPKKPKKKKTRTTTEQPENEEEATEEPEDEAEDEDEAEEEDEADKEPEDESQ